MRVIARFAGAATFEEASTSSQSVKLFKERARLQALDLMRREARRTARSEVRPLQGPRSISKG